jgi:acyl-CoA reductase-like NAD-dependent aldehyde dehydrogenase
MRYQYTEIEKAPVQLEVTAEDLIQIRAAVDAAAAADGSSDQMRRISGNLRRVLREVADQMQRRGRDLVDTLDRENT